MLKRLGIVVFVLLAAQMEGRSAESALGIRDVRVAKSFFNPALNQTLDFSFRIASPGKVSVQILDRDGFLVRTLVRDSVMKPGLQPMRWDGRNDSGTVVPDEAYSLKIDLITSGKDERYFPANSVVHAHHSAIRAEYYNRHAPGRLARSHSGGIGGRRP